MSASETTVSVQSYDCLYRRALKMTVCAVCSEAGFTDAQEDVLETLTEMLQSFLSELTRSCKAFSELSGRTDPLVTDVVMALIEMGQKVDALPGYARRLNRISLQAPSHAAPVQEPKRLQVGVKSSHKSHIMDYLPAFPDPHTYIKSATYKAPCLEYQAIREKAAVQKRDVERALTRFIAKTGDTENLFSDDPYAFPLIANKQKPLPYMEALMNKDQDLETSQQDDDEKLPSQELSQQQQEQEGKVKLERQDSCVAASGLHRQESVTNNTIGGQSLDMLDSDSLIDNPYLRPIKMPKLKSTTSKKYKF